MGARIIGFRSGVALSVVMWAVALALVLADDDRPNTGMANPAAFEAAFDRFVGGVGNPNVVVLSLSNLRGLSSEAINAGGRVTVDLVTGIVESSVNLLPQDGSQFDLWLVDNKPGEGHTTLAEPGDGLLKVGTYCEGGAACPPGEHRLLTTVDPDLLANLHPDRAFVVRSGASPLNAFLLTGASTTFARLQRRQVRLADAASSPLGFDPAGAERSHDIARLVAEGRQLFLHETFDGNGRACGTCHVESNNFTVDPGHIATLPPTDPLFVAETNPALATLENPDLMRRFGLILVNADGFDPPAGGPPFVLRATQNIQALSNSTTPQDPIVGVDFSTNGRNPNPSERLGWGNDGAPLRDFAIVAIAQHAPQTLGRTRGVDFRVPTDEELDALVAYQLALGRQEDFDLPALELKSALATNGKALFLDTGNLLEPGHKNCNACHFNGGGTTGLSFNPGIPGFPRTDGTPLGFNIATPTNVNEIPLALALSLPRDGGFGQIPTIFGSLGNTEDLPPPFGHLELEEFNSPPVVESADTGPFFHNHTVPDLESAIAFYGTPAFKASLIAVAVPVEIRAEPADPDVQAIAAFLRVLNALENIRSSIDVAERGRTMASAADKRELALLALAEADDAVEVLSAGAFAHQIEPSVLSARVRLMNARLALDAVRQEQPSPAVDRLLDAALRHLRVARSELANPATLPPSFQR